MYKPEKLFGMGQYNNYRLMLAAGWYCSLQNSPFWSSNSGAMPLPLLKESLELLFYDAVLHF
jgi:hypothetical protein